MTHHTNRGHDQSIIGLFRDRASAECCLSGLKQVGIKSENIKVAQKGERARSVESGSVPESKSESLLDSILNLFGGGNEFDRSLADLGFPDDIVGRYRSRVDSGNIMVATECEGNCDQLRDHYDRCGAFDVMTNVGLRAPYGSEHSRPRGTDRDYDQGTSRMPMCLILLYGPL